MKRRKTTQGWKCVSKTRYVHGSGARIERRGPPSSKPGWYLVPVDRSVPRLRFRATPEGFDEALLAFANRRAVLDELTRILTGD